MKNILILIQLTNVVIPQDVPQVEVESNHHFNPYLGHYGKIWERYFWTKKPELILVHWPEIRIPTVKNIKSVFHNFFMVADLLSPNRCHW